MAKVAFGERATVRRGATVEQLQQAWDRAVRQLGRLEALDVSLDKQRAWLQKYPSSDHYSENLRLHTVKRDVWMVELDEFYTRCWGYEKLLKTTEALEWQLREIHEYAPLGQAGLHGLRAERARALGLSLEGLPADGDIGF
jgi:hypothetical protein